MLLLLLRTHGEGAPAEAPADGTRWPRPFYFAAGPSRDRRREAEDDDEETLIVIGG